MKQFKNLSRLFAILLLTILIVPAEAQYLGINGQGYFENRDETTDAWIEDLFGTDPWTLRLPGGAATKYVDPLSGGGWGINYAIVDSITALYGSDEEEATADAVTKWRRKADAQPSTSYLDEIVSLQNKFPDLRVIWSANYLIPADRAFYPIDYLLDRGVNIVAVEIGNESYSQMNYDFTAYWDRTRPLVELIESVGVPVAYPIPATGLRGSRSHTAWIEDLNAVIEGAGAVLHIYYDGREFSGLKSPIDTALAYDQIEAWDFTGQFEDIKSEIPNAGFFIVTESNSQPASLIGDTELNRFLVTELLTAGRSSFRDFCLHNGVAPDLYGIIYGTGEKKRNTSYFAFQDVLGHDSSPDSVSFDCDTIISPAVYDTQTVAVVVAPSNPRCDRFFYSLFNRRKCQPVTIYEEVITLIAEADTVIDCDDLPLDTISTGCINTFGTNPTAQQCRTGSNDDYLHPERFINPDGSCVCDAPGVVFDHRINTKFETTIRNAIFDSTGVWIDLDNIDFFITLPETGETVKFYDIFNWCDSEGRPTWFNTNELVFARWPDFLEGKRVHTFEVEMWDRETGILISYFWQDHTTMDLLFTGL
jgi:hypothetical protein